MQNPFQNGDNNEGPNGLPVPPNYATVKNENGDVRIAKVGFSWTVLWFNLIVPIFRGDWYNLLCMVGIEMGVLFGIYSLPTNSMVSYAMSVASVAFNLVWAGLYNLMYFRHLFNRGFKPATDRSKELLTRAGYLPKEMR